MSSVSYKSHLKIPIFDGTDYPFWKEKMKIRLRAIDDDMWNVVQNGFTIEVPQVPTDREKKLIQMDAQAKDEIGGHLSRAQFLRYRQCETAKELWDILEKINEGVSTQKEARIDTLRAKFNRFKRVGNESCQQTFDRLSDIANELQGLGAKDITDHEVVKKLLRSLDSSFDTLVLMIRERADFKVLDSADIMERLNTHEEQEEEKRDLYGSSHRKSHALKAAPDSSSEENAEEDSDDPERISKDLALITKRFQRLHKKNQFLKKGSSNSGGSKSSSKSTGDYTCFKCKKPGHFISDCPLWEAEIRASGRFDSGHNHGKGKSKSYDSDDEKKTKKFFKKKDSSSKSASRSSSRNPSKSSSNRKNTSRKAKAYIGKEMDSEEEASSDSEEVDESDEDSDSGMAGIACASTPASNFFENHSSDNESPAYCFMAKASKEKVSSKHHKVHTSDQYSSDEDDHAKLIKIANIQQNSLEKIEKTLRKTEGLLVEEMEKNQSLTEEYSALKSRMKELSDRHDFLSVDHERLTYDYLKRKQELESLREAHEDLIRENSLLTQQLKEKPEMFVPPCLKCLERTNAESNAESSVNANPSVEEKGSISDENARLKDLLQTGMFKSLKGHQTLCDVLKKSILHKNPRKEGIGFERKLNENGSYWEPDQYPSTVWVPAKSKTLDPALLSGYDSPIPEYSYDDSLDNYKLFKNQRGEAVARYVGPNSRNGPPKEAIWVPKKTIEALPVTRLLTMQEENARYILEKIRQNEYMLVSPNRYTHSSGRNFNAYSFYYSRTHSSYNSYDYRKKSYPTRSYVSKPPAKMWVVKKA